MAEPLSIIASLIAVAQISGEVVSLCYSYRKSLKNASKQIMKLADEVKSLRDVLEQLINIVDQQALETPQLVTISRLAVKDGPLAQAVRELEALQGRLKPATFGKAFVKLLKWPLEEQEVTMILTQINRWKTTFMLAVTVDHLKAFFPINMDLPIFAIENARKVVFEWLDSPSPFESLEVARSKHCPQTCTWVLSHETYKQWHASSSRLLWVFGTGEHISWLIYCSSFVVDQLLRHQRSPDIAVTYFFIDSNELEKRKVDGLLKSILSQLASQDPTCLHTLYEYWSNAASDSDCGTLEPSRPTRKGLLETLKLCLQQFTAVYVVIDGLDESLDCEEFLQTVEAIRQCETCTIRFLITSRPTKAIGDIISSMGSLEIGLEESLVSSDIQRYVEVALEACQRARKWPLELTIEVRAHLVRASHGMFRWVECQLAMLSKCIKPLAVRKALNSLPITLDDTYEATANRIDQESVDDARAILSWMVATFRPLHLEELSEVLAFDWEDEPQFRASHRLSDIHDVLTICGDFLTIQPPGGSSKSQVNLPHSSVRDFLLSERRHENGSKLALEEGEAHTFAAKVSLTYLLSIFDQLEEGSRLRKDFPLARYAATYWVDHYRLASRKESVQHFVEAMFDRTNKHRLINWLQLHNIERPWADDNSIRDLAEDPASGLYYASVAGLHDIVAALLASGEPPDPTGGIFGSPLGVAAHMGFQSVVELLLEGGADVNQICGRTVTALIAAAARGHTAIVRLLLEYHADVNISGFEDGTALMQAAINGHLETVRLLLEAGADPNESVGKLGTALGAAAGHGHTSICKLLLEKGGKPDQGQHYYSNDCRRAAASGHTEIVELLFEYGSEQSEVILAQAARGRDMKIVNRLLEQGVSAIGDRALAEAAAGGSLETVQRLLSTDIDVNQHDKYNQTPIAAAAAAGHEQIVKVLLDQGALPDLFGFYWSPPLHAAAHQGYVKVVQALLEYDPPADVHSPGATKFNAQHYGPVLHNACFSGNLQIVEMVLERGTNVNFRGGQYGSPLQAGVMSGNFEVVEKLLQHGADVNAVGGEEGTALQAAASIGHAQMVAVLLDHGANLNLEGETTGFFGNTKEHDGHPTVGPLVAAAQCGYTSIVAMLLRAYALANLSPAKAIINAFEAAVNGPHVECAKFLLAQDISPDVPFPDSPAYSHWHESPADGNFAMRQTGRDNSVEMARMLVAAGANVDGASADGWTALHEAARHGHFGLIIVLMEELGANIHAKLVNGSEPIHLAAQEGHDTCVRVLLERGADVNITNFNGRTPLHIAAESGRNMVIPTLLRNGAIVTLRDTKASMTALDLAEMALLEWDSSNYHFQGDKAGFGKTVRMLLKHAAEPEASSSSVVDLLGSRSEQAPF
ncbi:hypothetical protein PV11_07917 [Exophiala sideris]|uniref:Uncharacterized protein n=1 Tax=Exophiala sideris TaxID=1016849 RepID=A0A0D1YBP6_9EURO|nr:hypothetical protein PV11_07917 [Exophiala sideris]